MWYHTWQYNSCERAAERWDSGLATDCQAQDPEGQVVQLLEGELCDRSHLCVGPVPFQLQASNYDEVHPLGFFVATLVATPM